LLIKFFEVWVMSGREKMDFEVPRRFFHLNYFSKERRVFLIIQSIIRIRIYLFSFLKIAFRSISIGPISPTLSFFLIITTSFPTFFKVPLFIPIFTITFVSSILSISFLVVLRIFIYIFVENKKTYFLDHNFINPGLYICFLQFQKHLIWKIKFFLP